MPRESLATLRRQTTARGAVFFTPQFSQIGIVETHWLTGKKPLGHLRFHQNLSITVPRIGVNDGEKRPHLGFFALDPVEKRPLLVEQHRRDAVLLVLDPRPFNQVAQRNTGKALR